MAGRQLLDTNAVVAMFGGDADVLDVVSHATEVFVPSIVLGELYFGAFGSAKQAENLTRVDDLTTAHPVLGVGTVVARRVGEVKDGLRRKGRPLPENDVWIAAIALEFGLELLTRDAHFHEVDGLSVRGW